MSPSPRKDVWQGTLALMVLRILDVLDRYKSLIG
jgi:hypothetical protein